MNQREANNFPAHRTGFHVLAKPSHSGGPQSSTADSAIDFRIARTRQDLCGAFRLLQSRYQETGLTREQGRSLRVMPYHLYRDTQLFVAVTGQRVVGTVTLVPDSSEGEVPMQHVYGRLVEDRRRKGSRFAEVCSLSIRPPTGRSTSDLFGNLTRLMMFYARQAGLDELVAVVHPRHAKFYQRAMGFRVVGEVRSYAQAAGQPGVAVLGSVNDQQAYRPRWRRFYFEGQFAEDALKPHQLSAADVAYFRQYVDDHGGHPATPSQHRRAA